MFRSIYYFYKFCFRIVLSLECFLKMAVQKDGNWLHVEIRDANPAMAKNALYSKHNPSLQAITNAPAMHNGGGLGLALTRRMINLSGGRLSVSQQGGHGNTLTVSYPALEETT